MLRLLEDDCTHQHLFSLAFKGIIGVEGRYASFAPGRRDQVVRINADCPISMSQFLSGGTLLKGDNEDPKEVMAWFQGNLHLFQKTRTHPNRGSNWQLTTSIDNEHANGKRIVKFIRQNLQNIDNFVRIMEDFKALKWKLDSILETKGFVSQPEPRLGEPIRSFWHEYKPHNFRGTGDYFDNIERFITFNNVPSYLESFIGQWNVAARAKHRSNSAPDRRDVLEAREFIFENYKFASSLWAQSYLDVNAERFVEF